MFTTIVLSLSVAWLIWIALIFKTTDLFSQFIFKAIPFGLGLCLGVVLLLHLGFIIPPPV